MKKLAVLLRRGRFRDELDEETAFHREQAEGDFISAGMKPEDARYAAARQFGNATRVHERTHETVGFAFEHVWQDCRYAARQLFRSPGFSASVMGTLMLGIGATTAIFTLVYATMMCSLPYPEADRTVRIHDVRLQGRSTGGLVSVPRFYDIQARATSFESVGFFFFEDATLIAGAEQPMSIRRAGTNAGFWRVYGARPLLGRGIDERDDRPNAPAVAVLSYRAWRQLFGGDPGVIGRQVTIEQKSTTIVGVMPREFNVPNGIDLWRAAQFNPGDWKWRDEGTRFINVFARLKPGVPIGNAQSDLQRIGEQLKHEHADTDGMWQFGALSLRDDLYGDLRPALAVLTMASGFLLLIACINVSNLFLTRSTARQREMALRRALGASERRIQLQFLVESVLLSLAGGLAGLGLTYTLVRFVASRLPGRPGLPGAVAMNWPVVGLAFALAVGAGIVFGVAPAVRNRRRSLNASLKSGEPHLSGTDGGAVRSVLIAIQVGLSLVLLIAACLLTESLWNLVKSPLGFAPDHLLTFCINLPWSSDQSAIRSFFLNTQQRIESLPGVAAVGQIDALPTVDWHLRSNFDADWLPRVANHPAIGAEDRHIAGNYLAAMATPLLAGRAFTAQDQTLHTKSIIVNQELARQYLPGGDPIGRHLIVGNESFQIVGMIADVRGTAGSIAQAPGPEVYWPADADEGVVQRYFVVRSRVDPEVLIKSIQEQVHQVDSRQAISKVATMDDLLDKSVAQPRVNMALVAAFAVIALLLACVGIYGVVAWSVAQRVREIGVRMALGATRGQISVHFVRRAAKAAIVVAAAGTCAALLLTRLLRSQLYQVAPDNPLIYAASIFLLLLPVFVATLWPALHAASINPVDALRTE
ncbi:MAG: ABC transporter permease [Terracidiphilus sp.]